MAFSGFGNTSNTGSSIFGQPNTSTGGTGSSIFGQPNPSTGGTSSGTSMFGQPNASNTGGTSTGTSLFGQPNQSNTGGTSTGTSLFGQPNTNTGGTSNTGTSLFGQPSSTNAGGSMFGNTQNANTNTGTSLFGQPASNTNIGTQPSSNIFGQSTTNPSGNQPSTNLFGQPASNTTAGGTSLFGQPAANTNTQSGTSLFGQQPKTGTSNLFGQSTPNSGPSLFGNPSNASQQPSTGTTNTFGGFGASMTQPSTGLGASTFGQPQQQQNANAPFTKSTKFNDLPDETKRVFESIESHIQGRVQISTELKQRKLGDEPTKGQELISNVHKELINIVSVMQSDSLHTRDLKNKTEQSVQDTIVATRIVDGFKNPQQNGAYLKNHASFPLEFFMRTIEEMKQRLEWYKTTIEQIERKLASTAAHAQSTPHAISASLQAQHATFMALANKTAAVDAELAKLKVLYTQLWRSRTGSVRDPFNDVDRGSGGEFGMDSLHLK
ncbi:hypothetical protein CONPUDRAFT_135559 [Coniophora puteana RWD-64-598 SS2]|uniref:Nucleoporin nup45 n=1 Tax=Coniophora puteana (strain RWD-64-598) TaxID=741705 RepID=A0A5M3MXS5_CONPW|nr:uncharacterized protein CONPUDRAFT_135559 [Coniophora puteana RWD-64-598 SS2]EIW83922.1 hypothetical protein CONPUDRAFT_135559 [Coniophora puteana RWD-64-598 SS2]